MNVTALDLNQLVNYLDEYRNKLAVAQQGDKRRKQTKLDIVFYGAMATLFETEICKRLPL